MEYTVCWSWAAWLLNGNTLMKVRKKNQIFRGGRGQPQPLKRLPKRIISVRLCVSVCYNLTQFSEGLGGYPWTFLIKSCSTIGHQGKLMKTNNFTLSMFGDFIGCMKLTGRTEIYSGMPQTQLKVLKILQKAFTG